MPGHQIDIKRLLLAAPCAPARQCLLTDVTQAIQTHANLFGQSIPAVGTLYTDVRLYAEAGIPGVIYAQFTRGAESTPSATNIWT
jgi:hypothetical protein